MAARLIKVVLLCPLQNPAVLPEFVEAWVKEGVEPIAMHGAGCEAVHNQIDDILVGDGLGGEERFIPTTWHNDATLEEVIDFASAFGSNEGIVRQVRL